MAIFIFPPKWFYANQNFDSIVFLWKRYIFENITAIGKNSKIISNAFERPTYHEDTVRIKTWYLQFCYVVIKLMKVKPL